MPEIQFADVIQVLIPLTVFIMMICLGTSLTLDNFKKVLTFPRAILTGIVGQMILMPAMAFVIAATLGSGNLTLQIGLILLAACPGGPLSNTFVYQGHGRVDLSVSLTAINGFLALLTTPLIASLGIYIFAGENTEIKLPLGQTILQVFLIAILPVVIGMVINYKFPMFALDNQNRAKVLSLLMLVIHLSLVVVINFTVIIESLHELFIPALLFCVLAMSLGYFSALLMGLDRDIRFTIGVEVGLQNVVLAILMANIILKRPEFALFVFTYGLAALLILFPWIYLHRRRSALLQSVESESV